MAHYIFEVVRKQVQIHNLLPSAVHNLVWKCYSHVFIFQTAVFSFFCWNLIIDARGASITYGQLGGVVVVVVVVVVVRYAIFSLGLQLMGVKLGADHEKIGPETIRNLPDPESGSC